MLLGLADFFKQLSDFDKAVTERSTTGRANALRTFDQDPCSDYDRMEDVVTAIDFNFPAFFRNMPAGRPIDL